MFQDGVGEDELLLGLKNELEIMDDQRLNRDDEIEELMEEKNEIEE